MCGFDGGCSGGAGHGWERGLEGRGLTLQLPHSIFTTTQEEVAEAPPVRQRGR